MCSIVTHHSDVIISAMASKICAWLFAQLSVQAQIKENIKAPRHWPLWGESGGFPHEGPVTPKMFPFDDAIMISSTACVGISNAASNICCSFDRRHWNWMQSYCNISKLSALKNVFSEMLATKHSVLLGQLSYCSRSFEATSRNAGH